jgi:hypothetical protein
MMKMDSPLHEVVTFLPPELAAKLMEQEASFQVEVLILLRGAMAAMENRGAQLDPVSLQAVVYGMGLLAITAVTNKRESGEPA